MKIHVRRARKSRRGAALVEFAVLSPLFMVFILGIIEIGRAIMVQELLTAASREGARVASYSSTTQTSTVTNAVNTYLSNGGVNGATIVVSPQPPSQAANGDQISVTVSIPYSQVSWSPAPFLLGGQTLTSTTVMCRQPSR